ncbi:MAG: WG repeat-containing protein [Ferruginibacter sp.]
MKKLLMLVLFLPVLAGYSQKWEKNYDYVDDCICGLSKVQKNGKVGYVNKSGVEVVKPEYNEGLTFHEGYTAVKQGAKWLYLDSTGKTITAANFDDAAGFSNGMAAVAKNNLYGFININGEIVIPFEFSNARSFGEGLAPAANAKGYWGFIDKKGNWVIKPVYHFADSFENGEARVMKGDKVWYIDKENKVMHE